MTTSPDDFSAFPCHCFWASIYVLFSSCLFKSITLKSHEPDKNLTYAQRCFKKKKKRKKICPINFMFRIVWRVSERIPWHHRKSLLSIADCVVVGVLLLFCAATKIPMKSRSGHRYAVWAASEFLVLVFLWVLIPESLFFRLEKYWRKQFVWSCDLTVSRYGQKG